MLRLLIGVLLLASGGRADARPDLLGDVADLAAEYSAFRAEHGDVLEVEWRAILVEAEAIRQPPGRPTEANLSAMIDDLRVAMGEARAAKVVAERRRSEAHRRADIAAAEQAKARPLIVGAEGAASPGPPAPDRRRLWMGLGVVGGFLVVSAAIVGVWLCASHAGSPLDDKDVRFTIQALGVAPR